MVAAGGTARYTCRTSRPAELSWLHDATPLPAKGPALELRGVTRLHRGMYQCLARTGTNEVLAAAELRLAGAPRYRLPRHSRCTCRQTLDRYLMPRLGSGDGVYVHRTGAARRRSLAALRRSRHTTAPPPLAARRLASRHSSLDT